MAASLRGVGVCVKCPRCRKEIAFAAMEHPACGWKLASKSVPIPKTEAGEKAFAAMRSMIKRPPLKVEERKPALKLDGVEVTPGHGGFCTCELCFPKRMRPRNAGRIAALSSMLELMLARGDDGPDTIP